MKSQALGLFLSTTKNKKKSSFALGKGKDKNNERKSKQLCSPFTVSGYRGSMSLATSYVHCHCELS